VPMQMHNRINLKQDQIPYAKHICQDFFRHAKR
jgi:hypothetical protein